MNNDNLAGQFSAGVTATTKTDASGQHFEITPQGRILIDPDKVYKILDVIETVLLDESIGLETRRSLCCAIESLVVSTDEYLKKQEADERWSAKQEKLEHQHETGA